MNGARRRWSLRSRLPFSSWFCSASSKQLCYFGHSSDCSTAPRWLLAALASTRFLAPIAGLSPATLLSNPLVSIFQRQRSPWPRRPAAQPSRRITHSTSLRPILAPSLISVRSLVFRPRQTAEKLRVRRNFLRLTAGAKKAPSVPAGSRADTPSIIELEGWLLVARLREQRARTSKNGETGNRLQPQTLGRCRPRAARHTPYGAPARGPAV